METPTLFLRPATLSDGSLFPLRNMWWPEAPDGRALPEMTTPQVVGLALREGWNVALLAESATEAFALLS